MARLQHANIMLLVGALCVSSIPAAAQSAGERLADRDVKKLIDQVDEGRDKFEGNLDNKLKNGTYSGPNGDRKVSAVLQDFQDSTRKLQDRFKDTYAAGTEVTTVLKQATAIDRFMQGTSSVASGRREWDNEVASLRHLAEAYGVTFPLSPDATAHRANDKQVAADADAIAKAANGFKDTLGKDSTLPKADKDAARKDVELLIRQAETVRNHANDGKPATADVRQLVAQVAKVQTFVDAHPIPAGAANWQAVQTSLAKVRQAYGVS